MVRVFRIILLLRAVLCLCYSNSMNREEKFTITKKIAELNFEVRDIMRQSRTMKKDEVDHYHNSLRVNDIQDEIKELKKRLKGTK